MQAGVAGDAVGRSSALDESLARAHQLAVTQGHASVALEHLLFALTDDAEAAGILATGRGSLDQLRTDVSAHIGRFSDAMPAEAGKAPVPGADLLRILQLAGMAARQSQRRTIDGGIVLAAVIGDGNSPAAGLLKAHGLTFDDAIRALQQVGTPRQQEIATEPTRAELPSPPQANNTMTRTRPDDAARAQAPETTTPAAVPQRAPATSSADDVLAATRARVKKSEPRAVQPVVTPPPPLPAPAPEIANRAPHASQATVAASPATPMTARADLQPAAPRPPDARLRPVALPTAMPPLPVQTLQQAPPPPLARLRQGGAPGGAPSAPLPPPMLRPQIPPPMHVPPAAQTRHAPLQPNYPPLAPAHMPPQPPPPRNYAPPPPIIPPQILLPIEALDIVGAAGGLPASVRRNAPVLVEIRIPRSQVDVPRHGPQAGAAIVRAVTVRLTSGPVSGLSIEPRTPETAWLGPTEVEANARDIIWQFVLLPTRPGVFAVTLHVTGRTIAPGGMTSDVAASAETFAVKVKGERGSFLRRVSGWLLLLGGGGAIGWALTGPLAGLVKALVEAVWR